MLTLMVPQPKTPILNWFYYLLWFYLLTVSEFSYLTKSYSVSGLTPLPPAPSPWWCWRMATTTRIMPLPLERRWDLEAVDSMLPRDIDLRDGPAPLLRDQPPDPLTAIVSSVSGTWHPGRALYCLWWWVQQRLQHTRDNLCPVFAIHQIPALAAGYVPPAIHTEEEARAAHTSLVSEIFAALRTALVYFR